MSDRLMHDCILRILAVGLRPLLQRRRHDLDSVEQWQPGIEAGLTSLQSGRGPPCRSSAHVVRDRSFTPLITNRNWRVTP